MSRRYINHTSPFVVGRPLRADEPIFGREEAFRFIATELTTFSSVNVIGERRMGKTSLLNHLIGNQGERLVLQSNEASLVLAHLDFQRDVTNAPRFYGAILREFLDQLSSQIARTRKLADLSKRLNKQPEAQYDEFEQTIRELRHLNRIGARPVIVIDEFEYLIEPSAKDDFPYPSFFNGLRSMIGDKEELLAMIVASRRPLAEYFSDPARQGGLTSTFPNYFQPFTLGPLDGAAADELLFQKSDHKLSNREVEEAKQWAKGHPCHLQVAGAALYQAKASGRDSEWAYDRREELKGQSCLTLTSVIENSAVIEPHPRRPVLLFMKMIFWYLAIMKMIFWYLPMKFGRLVQRLGAKIDEVAAWIIGVMLIVFVILVVLGIVPIQDFGNWVKKIFGIGN